MNFIDAVGLVVHDLSPNLVNEIFLLLVILNHMLYLQKEI